MIAHVNMTGNVILYMVIVHVMQAGPKCEHKCPEDKYGVDCTDTCRCQNQGSCDHISGACLCAPGWTGPVCEISCLEGTYGSACINKCECENGGSCNPILGTCNCSSGWTGEVCAHPCPQGTYGENCKYTCECYNEGSCDPVSGKCQCTAGYIGSKCQEGCNLGKYGVNCSETCDCKNEGICLHISGSCVCKEGWLGKDCSQPACPPNLFGQCCTEMCSCEENNTERCHPHTGACMCKAGWAGKQCTLACPLYTYGEKCSETCNCKNGEFCDPINDSCKCAPGYYGKDCSEQCPKGYYGQNCELKCQCGNGEDCLETCNREYHGIECDIRCACVGPNSEGCDPVTGECICKPGFKGKMKNAILISTFLAVTTAHSSNNFKTVFQRYVSARLTEICLGKEALRNYLAEVKDKVAICAKELSPEMVEPPETTPNTQGQQFTPVAVQVLSPEQAAFLDNQPAVKNRQKRDTFDPFYNENKVRSLKNKAINYFESYTCIMKQLGYMNPDVSINVDQIMEATRKFNLNRELEKDLLNGIEVCYDIASTPAISSLPTTLPEKWKRAKIFFDCTTEQRMSACIKNDLRTQTEEFDFAGLDGELSNLPDSDKMLAIIWADIPDTPPLDFTF